MKHAILLLILLTASQVFAQKTLTDGIEDLAQQIAERAKTAHVHRVAVMPFPDLHHAQNDIGAYIAEQLTTSLAIQQVDVAERSLLDRVLAELKLQQTGAIDPATAQRIGKLAGADAIVIGTITEFPTTLNVTCRVIATATGSVITGASTRITIDSDVNALRKNKPPENTPDTPNTDTAQPAAERPSATGKAARLIVESATRRNKVITITLRVEAIKDRPTNFWIRQAYLLDENGDRWNATFGQQKGTEFTLHPRTSVRIIAAFHPLAAATGTTFTLITGSDGGTIEGLTIK